jgi:hypothetical protein
VKVGLTSCGDRPGLFLPALKPLLAECDVVICATNEGKIGKLIQTVKRLAESCSPPFEVVWIKKAVADKPESFDAVNKRTAATIMRRIDEALENAKGVLT